MSETASPTPPTESWDPEEARPAPLGRIQWAWLRNLRNPRIAALTATGAVIWCGVVYGIVHNLGPHPSTVSRQAVATAATNLGEVKSYHVSGKTGSSIGMDVVYKRGVGSTGTLTFDGQPVAMVKVDGVLYLRGSQEWLTQELPKDVVATVGDKWLKLPSAEAAKYAPLVDGAALAQAIVAPKDGVTQVDDTVVNGQRTPTYQYGDTLATVAVTDDHLAHRTTCETGAAGCLGSAQGTALPLEFRAHATEQGAEVGVLTFDSFNIDASITAPRSEQVIDATPFFK